MGLPSGVDVNTIPLETFIVSHSSIGFCVLSLVILERSVDSKNRFL